MAWWVRAARLTRGADPNHQQFFLLNLYRYDLGKIYTINSYDHVGGCAM